MPVKKKQSKSVSKKTSGKKPTERLKTKEMKQKRIIMWLGIVLMTALILFMWSLNTWSTFTDIDKNKQLSLEAKLLSGRAENFKKIIDSADIKENLQKIQVQKIEIAPTMTDAEKLNLLIKNINEISISTTSAAETFTTGSDNIILETQN